MALLRTRFTHHSYAAACMKLVPGPNRTDMNSVPQYVPNKTLHSNQELAMSLTAEKTLLTVDAYLKGDSLCPQWKLKVPNGIRSYLSSTTTVAITYGWVGIKTWKPQHLEPMFRSLSSWMSPLKFLVLIQMMALTMPRKVDLTAIANCKIPVWFREVGSGPPYSKIHLLCPWDHLRRWVLKWC